MSVPPSSSGSASVAGHDRVVGALLDRHEDHVKNLDELMTIVIYASMLANFNVSQEVKNSPLHTLLPIDIQQVTTGQPDTVIDGLSPKVTIEERGSSLVPHLVCHKADASELKRQTDGDREIVALVEDNILTSPINAVIVNEQSKVYHDKGVTPSAPVDLVFWESRLKTVAKNKFMAHEDELNVTAESDVINLDCDTQVHVSRTIHQKNTSDSSKVSEDSGAKVHSRCLRTEPNHYIPVGTDDAGHQVPARAHQQMAQTVTDVGSIGPSLIHLFGRRGNIAQRNFGNVHADAHVVITHLEKEQSGSPYVNQHINHDRHAKMGKLAGPVEPLVCSGVIGSK